ncbi:transcriptional regulator MntR, partial [Bacillus paralicheniformis]|nr:transcriptional regulator MntR [Bacillus paralicheniformis]
VGDLVQYFEDQTKKIHDLTSVQKINHQENQ